jgi:hypothetical protein
MQCMSYIIIILNKPIISEISKLYMNIIFRLSVCNTQYALIIISNYVKSNYSQLNRLYHWS